MEKYAWRGKIKNGMIDEYVKRHNEIWPEMVNLLKSAGISNYSIWNINDEVFGYYECEKGIEFAANTQNNSPIVEKWNEYMQDILYLETDPVTKAQLKLTKVFELD